MPPHRSSPPHNHNLNRSQQSSPSSSSSSSRSPSPRIQQHRQQPGDQPRSMVNPVAHHHHHHHTELFRTEAALAAEHARNIKADRLKDAGQPIRLASTPIAIAVRDDDLWTAENGHVLRRSRLETGATLQIYKGHEGPVTCLAFHDEYVITGSWDKTIRVWNTKTKVLMSTKKAHTDFVKCLLVIPSLRILASGGSDRVIRLWDLSDPNWAASPLKLLGAISDHTRPVVCLAADENSFSCTRLFSADSLGAIKVWRLDRQYGTSANCKGVLESELSGHRTGVNDMWHGAGMLWTASTDMTLQLHAYPLPLRPLKHLPVLEHSRPVRCVLPFPATQHAGPYVLTGAGDSIRAYDFSSLGEPEQLAEIDAHSNDVTALAYWYRVAPGRTAPELWVVSAGLDNTVRKWKLADLVSCTGRSSSSSSSSPPHSSSLPTRSRFQATEEEERELQDLMDSEESTSESSPEPDDRGPRRVSPPPASSGGSSAEALPTAIAV